MPTLSQAKVDAARWERARELVERAVRQLNETLGYADTDKHRVTFGYIGNGTMTASGWDLRNVRWMVSLPHPGRGGTSDDQIGFVQNGDAEGLAAVAGQVLAFRRGVEHMLATHGMSQHELVKVRNEQATRERSA